MTVRLLKVIVQAVLVEEAEDGTLRERVCEPATVHAADLPDYPARLAEQIRELN